MIADTHCHLDLLERQSEDTAIAALQRAETAGLKQIVQISVDLASAKAGCELARSWNKIEQTEQPLELMYTMGLHPESAAQIDELDDLFTLAEQNLDDPYFLGIGETGLDYFHTTEFEKQQKASLEKHAEFAAKHDLPIVLHVRDDRQYIPGSSRSVDDARNILFDQNRNLFGVMHCFTYSYDEARPFVDRGWMVSFSGIVTYKTATFIQDAALRLPLENIMVETDAPYLAPVPKRGKKNEPAYVTHTLDYICNLRAEKNGEDQEQIRQTIYENSLKFMKYRFKSKSEEVNRGHYA